nr:hypothetical protein [Clostridioides sp.]
MKKLNREKIITQLKEDIARIEEEDFVKAVVIETLKEFENKKITKRVATKLEKNIKKLNRNYEVSYRTESYGWISFIISKSDDGINFTIYKDELNENGVLKMDCFNERMYKEKKQINQILESTMKDLKLVETTNAIEKRNDTIEEYNKIIAIMKQQQEQFKSAFMKCIMG